MQSAQSEYYLQIVKSGQFPQWPVPEEELVVGSQEIGAGYSQFWAYSKDTGKESTDLPHAEVVASEHLTHDPVVLIDQPLPAGTEVKNYLELILAKDGHAWGKTESSLENLDDNLGSILDYAKNQLGIQINHFMTTKRVSPEVETKLDQLEGGDGNTIENEEAAASNPVQTSDTDVHSSPFAQDNSGSAIRSASNPGSGPSLESKWASQASDSPPRSSGFLNSKMMKIGIVLVLLIMLGGAAFMFRDKITSKFNNSSEKEVAEQTETPTPTPEPSPTPTPVPAERKEFKVRVLNGTTKAGAAGALADKLKNLEWQVINTGNNSKQDIEKTIVRAKSATDSAALTMVSDLAPDLKASISADLKKTDKADLEVVIGKE